MGKVSEWTIDETSGHLAHVSGLYAYYSKSLTETGALLCVGPFSSYTKRLSKIEVLSSVPGAIALIEATLPNNCYTVWGTYSEVQCNTLHKIDILGDRFDFVANPCFRTEVLLNGPSTIDSATKRSLSKEWSWCTDSNEITHRIGLRFVFSRSLQNGVDCSVSVSKRTRDLELLHYNLKPVLLKSLCTTAVSVLEILSSAMRSRRGREVLSIRVAEDLLTD